MKKISLVLILLGLLVSCSNQTSKNTVFVSILPQKYFVEQLAEDIVEVEVMVQPGASPATYEVSPKQMARLAEAKIFFRIGVPFEKAWLPKIKQTNSNLKIVDTRTGIKLRDMQTHLQDNAENHHGSHAKDPHIWLSPLLVKKQVENIANALIKEFPNYKHIIQNNLISFQNELQILHEQIAITLKNLPHRKFLVFHPSWGYFAQEFNLEQIPIEIEGKDPNSKEMAAIIDLANQLQIKTIFIQKQNNSSIAKSIAEQIGGNVVAIDPLATNYKENLLQVAAQFKEVLDE